MHLDEELGHVLVFLSGQDEIEVARRMLIAAAENLDHPLHLKLRPVSMYAALSPDEQAEAFVDVPTHIRKVVLATNIAETSVTIPGVRYVIDSGVVKARAFSATRCMESLQVQPSCDVCVVKWPPSVQMTVYIHLAFCSPYLLWKVSVMVIILCNAWLSDHLTVMMVIWRVM